MAIARQSLATAIRSEAGIDVAFQPIFDLDTGWACAYEALVRGLPGESAASILARALTFHAYGFRVALDDFGAGYSGLVTLAQLPTDWVKLDMALIRHIDQDGERRMIVARVVEMLRDLGREIVAEGVETTGELAAVRALGISKVQGFLLGRPSLTELQARPYPMVCAA